MTPQIKTQDKKKEQEFFDQYVSKHGDHDLCMAESYELVLRDLGFSSEGGSLKILDAGNGTGLWSEMLAWQGHKVWGFDLSLNMARAGKSRKGLDGRFFPFVGDIEYMAIKSGRFDVCFGAGILHHLPTLEAALSEVERVLADDGRFCFFEPNGSNPRMRKSYLLRILLDNFLTASGRFSSVNEQTHPLSFYEKQLRGRFADVAINPVFIRLKRDPCYIGWMRWGMLVRNVTISILHRVLPARYGCNFVLIMGKRK